MRSFLPRCALVLSLAGATAAAQLSLAELGRLRAARDPAAMERALTPMHEKDPEDPAVLLGLAEVYASEGRRKDAARSRALLDALAALPPSPALAAFAARAGNLRELVLRRKDDLAAGRRRYFVSSVKRLKTALRDREREAARLARQEAKPRKRIPLLEEEIAELEEAFETKKRRTKLKKLRKELATLRATLRAHVDARVDAECEASALRGHLARVGALAPEKSPVDRGLSWLSDQQRQDGRWSAAKPPHDVGVTALCLLALLAGGHESRHTESIGRGLAFLRGQQEIRGQGVIGRGKSRSLHYGHALATLAIVEAHRLGIAAAAKPAQRAVDYIVYARNPAAGWRYAPRDGASDASVSGLMTLALLAARDAGLRVDADALTGAGAYFRSLMMGEDFTGRVPYRAKVVRSGHRSEDFPHVFAETPTALALLCRLRLGAKPGRPLELAEQRVLRCRPVWSKLKGSIDYYWWFLATCAMSRRGGSAWTAWRRNVAPVLQTHQTTDGSWPPAGVFCQSGGESFATALALLTLLTVDRRSGLSIR